MTEGPAGGRAVVHMGAMAHLAGAAVSLALVAGVGLWGYRIFVRDMTGIPVVRAMAGPMREAPDDPGGQIAANTGLAVNAVAAMGEAAPPEDVVMLAPATPGLAPEDMQVQSFAEADEVMAGDPGPPLPAAPGAEAGVEPVAVRAAPVPEEVPVALSVPETPMTAAEVLALADMIATGTEPLTPLKAAAEATSPGDGPQWRTQTGDDAGDVTAEAVTAALAVAQAPVAERISPDVPGVRVAWRPPARPGTAAPATGEQPAPAEVAENLISPPLPAGTTLVQLGSYETAQIAAADWVTLSERFADFMGGKERVIQAAETGGESFVRLRASGFADVEDANRFCAALIAEGARCVPVVEE